MAHSDKTEQEHFWQGKFGDSYIERNIEDKIIASDTALFAKALSRVGQLSSVIELGANIGLNLRAIRNLFPSVEMRGVEINSQAAIALKDLIGAANVHEGSILDFKVDKEADLALVKGVLIHINPEVLDVVYQKLYQATSKYILLCEYYNPSPVAVDYRGHQNRLFKRDFAGEMLDKYPSLKLLDYGFVYRHDPTFPLDDITWFLLSK